LIFETYIGGNNLFRPGLSRELPISEERSTNLTVCTITTNNVVSLKSDFTIGGLASDSSRLFILLNADDFVRPEDFGAGAFGDMFDQNLTEFVQWQAGHSVRRTFDGFH
jgi:hypothetical protein